MDTHAGLFRFSVNMHVIAVRLFHEADSKKMVNSKGLLLMKICKRKLICFKLCFKVCGWMAGRETYVGVVNVTKMLDEVTVSFCPLKLRALSLASVPFHALPSLTHFFVPRNTRVCFYCATRTIEKI